ncbi:MAG TPA: MFS transporter, partial [Caulobacteraceae bacterium]|nr:MFS transporter [Caulobacteraceae bacterium]
MSKPYAPRLIAVIVAAAVFMGSLDQTVIATALPQMARAFHRPPVDLSQAMTIYILVMAAFLPVSTWVADRLGARNVFAAAI